MENLFVPATVAVVEKRISTLTSEMPNEWGKMNVAQMMAHCSAALNIASGNDSIPRSFIGCVLGPIFKSNAYDDKHTAKEAQQPPNLLLPTKEILRKRGQNFYQH